MNNRRKELMLASAREYCKCVVEGKTLKYNQLAEYGNFDNGINGWYGSDTTTIYADNNVLEVTPYGITYPGAYTLVTLTLNHKFLFLIDVKTSSNDISKSVGFNSSQGYNSSLINKDTNNTYTGDTNWHTFYAISTITASGDRKTIFVVSATDTFYIRNVMFIDLTLLGLDNITTIDQFLATDLGKYIAKGNYLPYEIEGKFINATSPINFNGVNIWNSVFENGLTLQKGDTYKSYEIDEISYNNLIPNANQDYVNSNADARASVLLSVYDYTNDTGIFAESISIEGFYEFTFTSNTTTNGAKIYNSGVSINQNFTENISLTNGHLYYLSLNLISCNASVVGGLRIANLRLIDLTLLGLSALTDKLRIFLNKNYCLPYSATNKAIKDQLVRTMKEIDLSTLTWHYVSHDMVWYADLPSGCKNNNSQEESGNIIAEKYKASAFENEEDKTICIGELGWLVSGGSCIFVFDSNYNNPTQPSGKALIELLTPELIEYYVVRITNPTFEYVSGNIKKSTLAYDFDIFKVGNVPQVFVPIMATPNYLTPKTYAQMEQTAETCAYRPSDKHIYINTQYEVDSTQKTIIYMIIPTRMVSRRTINVESGNGIDLDFTKE